MKNLSSPQVVMLAKALGLVSVAVSFLIPAYKENATFLIVAGVIIVSVAAFVMYVMNNHATTEEKKQYNKRLSFALIALVIFAVVLWVVKYR